MSCRIDQKNTYSVTLPLEARRGLESQLQSGSLWSLNGRLCADPGACYFADNWSATTSKLVSLILAPTAPLGLLDVFADNWSAITSNPVSLILAPSGRAHVHAITNLRHPSSSPHLPLFTTYPPPTLLSLTSSSYLPLCSLSPWLKLTIDKAIMDLEQ